MRANAALDYETRTSYEVIVTATNPDSLSDSVTLTINVLDVNDPPEVSGPTAVTYADRDNVYEVTVTAADPGGNEGSLGVRVTVTEADQSPPPGSGGGGSTGGGGAAPALVDRFGDDDGSVHEDAINGLAAAGVTVGCGEGVFCASQPVSRAQMATFLVRALELPEAGRDYFGDDGGSVHEDAINRLAAAGVTVGCGEGVFCASQPVSRARMATFLVRALEL